MDIPGFEWRNILLVQELYRLGHTRTQFGRFHGSAQKLHIAKSGSNYTPHVVISFNLKYKVNIEIKAIGSDMPSTNHPLA